MEKSIKIAIDLMGGEKSPDKNLEGVNIFLERNKKATDCFFYFFGKESQVKEKISKYKYLKNNYKLFDSKIVVSDDLSALSTIKKGKNTYKTLKLNKYIICRSFYFTNYWIKK